MIASSQKDFTRQIYLKIMRDPASAAKIILLHPKLRVSFSAFIDQAELELNLTIYIIETLRSFARQQAYYEQGRTKPGEIITWSPAGTSYHNYGLAADICPYKPGGKVLDWNYDFGKLAAVAKAYGITWGGNFPDGKKDTDHFENKLGFNWRELLHRYNNKDFLPETTYINL